MLSVQIFTLIISTVSCTNQKADGFGFWRPRCCSDNPSPLYRRLQPWTDTLREATYQSIIHHLDYQGTLDGRLDRDQKLQKHLQEARFIVINDSPYENPTEETKTGILVETTQSNQQHGFEFQQTNNPDFDCPGKLCTLTNNSLLALWRVRKSDNAHSLWIRVKLPKMSGEAIEDMYFYSAKFGLKKLTQNPTQPTYIGNHRFSSFSKKKSEFKNSERMDFPFSSWKHKLSSGRVIPSSFIFDSPFMHDHDSDEDEWFGSSPRKPFHSALEEESPHYNSPEHYRHSGFQHTIPGLPSVQPPQNLDHFDHSSHDMRSFMPSVGPMSAPPPYRTEYSYDPRYVLYYNRQQNSPLFTTQPPDYFKPSREYVRYSEVDPFYHPESETGVLKTSLDNPSLVDEQLLTNSPNGNTKPFQIIVGNERFNLPTTSKPTSPFVVENKPTTIPTRAKLVPKIQDMLFKKPDSSGNDKTPFIAFGEKLKPKTSTTERPKSTTETLIPTTKPETEFDYRTEISVITSTGNEEVETIRINKPEKQEESTDTSIKEFDDENKNFETEPVINSTQKMEANLTTAEMFTKITVPDSEDRSRPTQFSLEITTENQMSLNVNNITTSEFNTTQWELLNTTIAATVQNPNTKFITETIDPEIETLSTETVPTTSTDIVENTTEMKEDSTIKNTDITDFTDFFTSFRNSFFGTDLTTEMNNETATLPVITPTKTPRAVDPEPQESKHHGIHYRLLTFPGDPVSIVANRISKTVSFRTASGRERKIKSKQPLSSRYRFSNVYKDFVK